MYEPEKIKPKFSGHETFPFRYSWLTKVIDRPKALASNELAGLSPIEAEMVALGVGKNMVKSMHHWAYTTGVAESHNGDLKVTPFGRHLLQEVDPYLEEPETLWALHWRIASDPSRATTWFYMFNIFSGVAFDEGAAVDAIQRASQASGWKAVARDTLARDVGCFVRCYTVSRDKRGALSEESLECPLAELELIRPVGARGHYELQRGPKPSLTDNAFAFALAEFWDRCGAPATMGLEQVAHAPGSPGRVFLLDEVSVAERLSNLGAAGGAFRWVETAGLQQLQYVDRLKNPSKLLGRRQ